MRVCGVRTGIRVDVSAADRARLEAIMADRNSPQKHVWRAQIVVLTADGLGTNEIMRRTDKSKTCLWRWQERFMHEGVNGLLRDKTRPARVAPLAPAIGERIVALTQADPPGETTHWTAAAMAKLAQISVSSVQRIWRSHGLQPHRVRQFKLSRDPEFVRMQRHRHQEFIRFLNAIEAEIPPGKIIHVILDNYGPHKHPKTRAWLGRHPRFVFHYTPTSASWLSAVEGFFAKLTRRRLKRGVFCSIVDLQAAIHRFLQETNDDPKPFVWTADPDSIIAAVKRGHQALDSIH